MKSSSRLGAAALAAVLLFGPGGACAFGSSSSSSSTGGTPTNPDFSAAERAVKAGDYADATTLLAKVLAHDPKNADAWNYLGFSNRKLGKLPDALADYEKALIIDPNHLGANEYLGELYLETGDMAKAKERLAKLDQICLFGCEEYRTLKAAIDAKAKGS